jgi:hypothetical protein
MMCLKSIYNKSIVFACKNAFCEQCRKSKTIKKLNLQHYFCKIMFY